MNILIRLAIRRRTEMDQMYKCSEVMSTCKYSKLIGGVNRVCDYICMTGKSRKCNPEECDKYEERKFKS